MDPVARLLAIEGVRLTKAHYELSVLKQDWEWYASLFTEDCHWDESGSWPARNPVTGEWDSTGANGVSYEMFEDLNKVGGPWPKIGRQAILDTLKAMPDIGMYHEIFNAEIEILDEDNARAIWPYKDILHFPEGGPIKRLHGWGHYHERYVREGERWLISHLTVTRRFLYAWPD